MSSRTKTLPEVRQWFFEEGLTVTEWSHQHGFRPDVVYALLSGRTKGRRGDAHRAALALGLKRSIRRVEFAETALGATLPTGTLTKTEVPMPSS